MKTFLLEIITPSKVILPNHVPLMANLTEGELKIRKKGEDYFVAIGGGYLEVKTEKVQILVTRAVREDELNEKTILKAKKEAEEALLRKPTAEEFRTASALLRSSLIDLKILSKRKRFKQQ